MQKVSHQSALSAGWTDPFSQLPHVGLSNTPWKAEPRKGEGRVQCQCSGATQHMASPKAPCTGSREHGSTKVAATSPTHCPAGILSTSVFCLWKGTVPLHSPWQLRGIHHKYHWPPPGIPSDGWGWFDPGLASFLETPHPWRASLPAKGFSLQRSSFGLPCVSGP